MRAFVWCFALLFSLTSLGQANSTVSVNDFLRDISSSATEGRHTQLVLWLPTQYWEVMGSSMKVDQKAVDMIQNWVKDYQIIAVADGQVMDGGVIHFKSQPQLAEMITVADSTGGSFTPLTEKEIPEEVASLAGILKPVFNNLLGAFGEGMHLFVFKVTGKEGQNTIDAEKKGRFIVRLNGIKSEFELPLASLLPPKYCPVDQAKMSGTWSYCPYHGVKL